MVYTQSPTWHNFPSLHLKLATSINFNAERDLRPITFLKIWYCTFQYLAHEQIFDNESRNQNKTCFCVIVYAYKFISSRQYWIFSTLGINMYQMCLVITVIICYMYNGNFRRSYVHCLQISHPKSQFIFPTLRCLSWNPQVSLIYLCTRQKPLLVPLSFWFQHRYKSCLLHKLGIWISVIYFTLCLHENKRIRNGFPITKAKLEIALRISPE